MLLRYQRAILIGFTLLIYSLQGYTNVLAVGKYNKNANFSLKKNLFFKFISSYENHYYTPKNCAIIYRKNLKVFKTDFFSQQKPKKKINKRNCKACKS